MRVVVTLGTEDTIHPSVLMSGESHVIDICCRNSVFGHSDRLVPESEVVHAVGAFSHGEEALAVSTFHTYHKHVFPVPLDGA